MKHPVLVFIVSILLCFESLANVVRLAAEDSWPPFAKEDGSGIARTIIEKAYAYTGTRVEFITVPYARALLMAEQGKVDGAFNVTKQASTENTFAFGSQPLLRASASFYYPKQSKLNYRNVDEIPTDTVIATIIGYEYGDRFEANRARFAESRVASQQQIIKLLLSERIDMAILFDEVASYTLAQMGLSQDAIKQGKINHTSDIYVAFNKALANSDKLKKLDRGLKAIEQESAYITP